MRVEIGLPLATEPDDSELVSASKYGAALPELLRALEKQPNDAQGFLARPPLALDGDMRLWPSPQLAPCWLGCLG